MRPDRSRAGGRRAVPSARTLQRARLRRQIRTPTLRSPRRRSAATLPTATSPTRCPATRGSWSRVSSRMAASIVPSARARRRLARLQMRVAFAACSPAPRCRQITRTTRCSSIWTVRSRMSASARARHTYKAPLTIARLWTLWSSTETAVATTWARKAAATRLIGWARVTSTSTRWTALTSGCPVTSLARRRRRQAHSSTSAALWRVSATVAPIRRARSRAAACSTQRLGACAAMPGARLVGARVWTRHGAVSVPGTAP